MCGTNHEDCHAPPHLLSRARAAGYQINGIANRTSIADGNTWNLEHIAMLGRILTSPEKRAHSLARHLADYVLIWAGHHGDDLGKSPHMARISSSVYSDVCGPQDPLCHQFGFYSEGNPTPMMANSLLYKLHSNGLKPGVSVDPTLFEEAYRSQYGLVRIYKILNVSEESKAWIADPSNRVCDAPGSWYCVGKYPVSEACTRATIASIHHACHLAATDDVGARMHICAHACSGYCECAVAIVSVTKH